MFNALLLDIFAMYYFPYFNEKILHFCSQISLIHHFIKFFFFQVQITEIVDTDIRAKKSELSLTFKQFNSQV